MKTNCEKISVIYTTVGSFSEAKSMAEKAINNSIAACVNIIPNGTSVYRWENKVEFSSECYLIFKTTQSKSEDLYNWIITNHPYSCPAILKIDCETSLDFFNFVKNETDVKI